METIIDGGQNVEQNCFTLEMTVRDYECDMQGVVNNAVYQNYLEHARHEYLKSIGIDFAAITARGINLVVTRVEIDYRTSLTSGDRFIVSVKPARISPLRFGFRQTIIRLTDQKIVVSAQVTGTALNAKGRPQLPEELDLLLKNVSK